MYPKVIYIIQFFVLYLIRYLPSGLLHRKGASSDLKETGARDVNAKITSAGEGGDGTCLIYGVEGEGGGGGRAGGVSDKTSVFSTDGSGTSGGGDGGKDIPRLDDTSGGVCGGSDIRGRKSDCATATDESASNAENNIIIRWGNTSISTRTKRKSCASASTRGSRNGKLRSTESVERHFSDLFYAINILLFLYIISYKNNHIGSLLE
jgi:hypothetical protein